MAFGKQDREEEMIAGINITPLVDVTLVLLIIFMVTATYVVRESIEVDLPRAASGGESVGTTLNLTLDRGGTLYVDGAESDLKAARLLVRATVSKDESARAIISADKNVSHGQVVEIIDLLKGEGLSKFAINIEKDAASAK